MRRRLESYAAGQAADLANDEQVNQLDALTTRMEEIPPPKTPPELQEIAAINAEFPRIISEAAQSPRLMAVLQMAVDVGFASPASGACLQRASVSEQSSNLKKKQKTVRFTPKHKLPGKYHFMKVFPLTALLTSALLATSTSANPCDVALAGTMTEV